MFRIALVAAALAIVVGIPFALKPKESQLAAADDTLVLITPHNEAIRYEFTRAFSEFYKARTGRTVRLDWRSVSGTNEITRYLKSEFYSSFERFWTRSGRNWSVEAAASFDNPSVSPSASPESDTPAQSARRAFLESDVGVGIDLFFGGGAFDFIQQARAGRLVDCGFIQANPRWFTDESIPQMVSGEPYYDPEGRWIGTCLSSFGICYNIDSLERLGFKAVPASWNDLTNPLLLKQVALADPTKSGSAAKAFEMVIQQQMQETLRASGEADPAIPADSPALTAGWVKGLQLILKASANARYFTDSASKVPIDVSLGDAAIGMCIDFYGRFQSEAVQLDSGLPRMKYFTPLGGSSIGVDPIGLLRGAKNKDTARLFIEYVLSLDGQKLWNFKVGTPGGPTRYALRRLPIRKELYAAEYKTFLSDPEVVPYEAAKFFTYHEPWTGPLFSAMRFIIRVMCLDAHDEQTAAWNALITAGFPPQATATFLDMSAVAYDQAEGPIRNTLRSADRIKEVQLAKQLGDQFRAQYRKAGQLAREGK
jgi:iron(III) transport system substrate-binding protein